MVNLFVEYIYRDQPDRTINAMHLLGPLIKNKSNARNVKYVTLGHAIRKEDFKLANFNPNIRTGTGFLNKHKKRSSIETRSVKVTRKNIAKILKHFDQKTERTNNDMSSRVYNRVNGANKASLLNLQQLNKTKRIEKKLLHWFHDQNK